MKNKILYIGVVLFTFFIKSNIYGQELVADCTEVLATDSMRSSNITATSVDLSWLLVADKLTNNGTVEIIYGISGFDVTNSLNKRITTSASTITISNLTPNTSYDFYIKLVCQDAKSWVGPTRVKTLDSVGVICFPEKLANNFTAKAISSNTIELNFGILKDSDFLLGIAYGPQGSVNLNDPLTFTRTKADSKAGTTLIHGLKPSTNYEFYIKLNCQSDDLFVGPVVQSTASDLVVDCPTSKVITSFNITDINSSWVSFSWGNTVKDLNISVDANKYVIVYGLEGFSTGGGSATSRSLRIGNESRVVVNEPKATITSLQSQATYDFYIKLACQADEFLVGPFKIQTSGIIDPIAECPANKVIDINNFISKSDSPNSVELKWLTDNNTGFQFEIAYGIKDAVNLNDFNTFKKATVFDTNANRIVINNLLADTEYEFYLKAVCQSKDLYVGPIVQRTISNAIVDCVSKEERDALITLYNATNGANWTNKWDLTKPVCEWYGVTVFDGKVSRLILNNNNVSGTIPKEIGNLLGLFDLNLSQNKLTGAIPSELSHLSLLRELHLSINQLSGIIPPEFGNLNNLTYLSLNNNQLSGEIPKELGNLSKLKNLILASNQLINSIPKELANLVLVERLNLSGNQLTGTIPVELGLLTNVNALQLGRNQLSGVIPSELGNLSKLTSLELDVNQLSGAIPAALGNLSNLSFLKLNGNKLTGSIPVEFEKLSNLSIVYLNSNELTGSIPIELGNLSKLSNVFLYNNKLSGAIPAVLGNLSELSQLRLDNNSLTGNVPIELGKLSKLRTVYLGWNDLGGKLPHFISTSLSTLIIDRTNFVFSDFETEYNDYKARNVNFRYQYLSKVDATETLSVESGKNITLTSSVLTSPNNSYQWYKDGVAISGATNKEYVIANATTTSAGVYHFTATNSIVTDLTLTRNPITLKVTEPIDTCGVSETEKQALIDLYNSTNGANWTNKWDLTKPVCDWYGVTVFDGKVKELSLRSNNLVGNIPPLIGNLFNLSKLDFYLNKLSGTIPTEIGNLSLLNYLSFLNNSLTGEIPTSIKNLTSLQELNLGANQLSGTIPEEIGSLVSLRRLGFGRNLLTGIIPSSLGNLMNLNTLNLENNKFTGVIPSEFANLSGLTHLFLNNNSLTGEIPSNLGKLSNLQYLYLNSNQLTGEIAYELGNLSKLILLQLEHNLLTGTIPSNLGKLSNLTILYLNGNKLTGTIPNELGNLLKLEYLLLHENQLVGEIPFSIEKSPNINKIWIQNNRFVFSDFEANFLTYKNISQGINYSPQEKVDITETLSVESGKNITLTSTALTSPNNSYQWYKNGVAISGATNKEYVITNAIATNAGAYHFTATNSIVTDLTLTRNPITLKVTEPIDICGVSETEKQALIDLYNSTNGATWTNKWDLTKPVCEWYGVTVVNGKVIKILLNSNNLEGQLPNSIGQLSNLENLELYNNKISGSIPTEIGNLSSLKILYLSQNLLIGEIPSSIGNLSSLEKIWLYENQLTGNIPTEIGNLSSLKILLLSKNLLTGEIPISIGNLSKLEGIWLYENELTGKIPAEIGNLTSLENLHFGNNLLTGEIPLSIKNLSNLKDFYLNGNRLTGIIPQEFGSLPNLRQLILSSNLLTGSIPSSIGNLLNLETLWLNGNQLSGAIPSELGNSTNLKQVLLSHNKLIGEIPISLGNLSNLTTLALNFNELTGSIPKELGNLSKLNILNLSGNNLIRVIPLELGTLSNLVSINLYNNKLEGKVPFSTDKISELKILKFEGNQLVFSDFEDDFIINKNSLNEFKYSPQAKVDATETLSVELGKSITLTSTALTSPNNRYQWYKDGIAISGATNKEYVIANATTTNAGVYHFTATNSIVTDLTLTRNPITLKVTEPVDPICFPEKLAANFIAETVSSNTIELDFGILKDSDFLLEIAYGVQGTVNINDPLTFTRIKAASNNGGTLITGLKPSTHYEFYIKLKCQSDNLFSGPVVQHTGAEPIDPTCPIQPITSTPQTFSVKGVSSSSIEIRWGDNVKESHQFEIAYGEATSFNINDINTYNTVTSDVTVKPILINNLKPSTLYSFYIKAACQEHSYYIKIADGITLGTDSITCPNLGPIVNIKDFNSFSIKEISSSSIKIGWGDGVDVRNPIKIAYGVNGVININDPATYSTVITDPMLWSKDITGLKPSTSYVFYVKAECQTDDFYIKVLEGTTSDIQTPDCPTEKIVTKFLAESRSSSSIEVFWNVSNRINNYDFEIAYGKSFEVDLGNPNTYTTIKVFGQNGNIFITGLEASTSYEFYIKYQCQSNNLYFGPISQHTLAGSGGCSNQQYRLSGQDITSSSVKLIWGQLVIREPAIIEDEIPDLVKGVYTIKYGLKGFVLDSFQQLGQINTTEKQLVVDNLESGKTYDFYLVKNCVGGDLVVGPETVTILDDIPNCSHHKIASGPGSFLAHGMSPERVRILWKFGVDASQPLKVAYGKTETFDLTNPHTYKTVTTLPNAIDVNIYGLEDSTSYTFYMKAECQSNDLYVGPIEATTLSNLIDIDIDIEAIKATPGTSFRPMYEKRYVVSGWVKENNNDGTQQATYKNSAIRLYTIALEGGKLSDPVLINDFYAKGEVIDGWQRIEEVFVIKAPNNGELTPNNLIIELVNKSSETTSYFDDIRIFPFNASIKSFVYDNKTKKLMAELDENNYATYYEYDKEGGLVRVKKETSKGVYTIQETRSSNAKN